MTTETRNEAAERLCAVLVSFDYERHVALLDEALAAERRATVERIQLALEGYKLGFDTAARTDYYRMEDVYAVLRAEAAR